jgi:hypothetical protein
MKLKIVLIRIIIVIFSTCITLIAIELLLHKFSSKKELNFSMLLQPKTEHYWVTDKDLIIISQDAFKALNTPLNHTQKNIVTIGDSFVRGTIDSKDSFPSVLEDLFKQERMNFKVINLGGGGYNADQEFRLFNMYLQRGNRPDCVIWSFYGNDIYEGYTQPVFDLDRENKLISLDASINWMYLRQRFYDAIPLSRNIKFNSILLNRILFMFELYRFDKIPQKYTKDPNEWSTEKIKQEVLMMDQLARAYNFAVYYVLIYPQARYMSEEFISDNMQWIMTDTKRLYDILSLQKNFIPLDFSTPISSNSSNILGIASNLDDYIFADQYHDPLQKGTRHFNKLGYQMFAEKLFDTLLLQDFK